MLSTAQDCGFERRPVTSSSLAMPTGHPASRVREPGHFPCLFAAGDEDAGASGGAFERLDVSGK
jgi:hypothetical protein